MELSLPSLVSMAGYDKLAVPNQTPSFKRTDIGPRDSVPLVMADLSAGDGAGFNVLRCVNSNVRRQRGWIDNY